MDTSRAELDAIVRMGVKAAMSSLFKPICARDVGLKIKRVQEKVFLISQLCRESSSKIRRE